MAKCYKIFIYEIGFGNSCINSQQFAEKHSRERRNEHRQSISKQAEIPKNQAIHDTSLLQLMQSEQVRGYDDRQFISNYNKTLLLTFINKSKATSAALVVILVLFAIECIMSSSIAQINPSVLVQLGGNVAALVHEGEFYRLAAAMFLHAGALHMLMNSASLLGFCAIAEQHHPFRTYFLIYLLGGIQGNMLSAFYGLNFGNPDVVGIGASTSICAIMGLYVANVICLFKKNQNVEDQKQAAIRMVFSLLIISLIPGVDLLGHLGSLAGGLFLGMSLIPGPDKQLKVIKWTGWLLESIYMVILLTIFF